MNEMICKIKIIHGLKNVTSTQLTVHIKTEEHILYQERPLDTKLCIHTKLKNIFIKTKHSARMRVCTQTKDYYCIENEHSIQKQKKKCILLNKELDT